jgi:hypothetical protein
MSITFIGLLGYIGITLFLLAYFLLVVGQLKVIDMHYIMLNLIGTFLIVLSLYNGGAVPVFQALVAWILISLYSFYKHHLTTTT